MKRTGKNNSIYENKLDLHTLFIYEKKKLCYPHKFETNSTFSLESFVANDELHNNIFNRQTFFFYEFLPKIFRFHPKIPSLSGNVKPSTVPSNLNVTKNTVKKNDRGDERSNGSATRNSRTIVTESRCRQWTIEEKRRRWCVSRCARRNIAACNGHWRRACSPGPF